MSAKPTHLAVDVMDPNPCNEDCIDCYYREAGQHPDVPLDESNMDRLKTMSERLSKKDRATFFLYPREITTAQRILDLYPDYGVDRVLSNGKLLNSPGMLNRIKQAGVKTINITLPGSRESYMEYTREPAAGYDRLLENIELTTRSGLDVSLFMPIYKGNIDEVVPTVEKAAKLGVEHMDFIRMTPLGNGQNLPTELFASDKDIPHFLSILNDARNLKDTPRLSLFRGSWGPNFYSHGIFRYLSGQNPTYPQSHYFCPIIDQQYLREHQIHPVLWRWGYYDGNFHVHHVRRRDCAHQGP